MNKIINLFIIIIVVLFYFNILQYYLSNKNIKIVNQNRSNIEDIIKKKTKNTVVLENDTNNVIEFNSSFSEEIQNNGTRNFWNLLKSKWKKKQK